MTLAAIEFLSDFLQASRWFGGKGRHPIVTAVTRAGELPAAPPGLRVAIDLIEVTYDNGDQEFYQAPLSFYDEPQDHLAHALVGEWEDANFGPRFVYDAVHDREAMALWLQAFASTQSVPDGLTFHRLPGHALDLESHSTLFPGEQSNSSVAFGEDAMLKIFRKVTPGINPDIAIHQILTESGSEHVAALYGWLDLNESQGFGSVVQLAMLQQFLRTASDGWELAQSSVRDLFTEADLHAEEVGGDFAAEAARLGSALAEVHATLAQTFAVDAFGPSALTALNAEMHGRLDAALAAVPDLARHEGGLREVFDRLLNLRQVDVQRIHGDLHLGQTLRTVKGWKFIDFEGEPARPLAQRLLPDSRWRDVAGMLRSFDYAPQVAAMTSLDVDPGNEAEQRAYRAAEWTRRNSDAFLDAYRAANEPSPADLLLLNAYVADKAVYEVLYEVRNRPGWELIPLQALDRLQAEEA